MQKENLVKKSSIKNLMALNYIVTDYKEFSKRLVEYMELSDKNEIYTLSLISKGNIVLFSRKAKKFYQKNKKVIDTINTYSTIVDFSREICDANGKLNESSCISELYNFLIENPSQKELVADSLQKMKDLGIGNLTFDSQANFEKEIYEPFINVESNFRITYLNNMKTMSTYRTDCIKYRTTDSCYKIIISPHINEKSIFVNSFELTSSSLPIDLSNDSISRDFELMRSSQEKNNKLVKNSVDLNVSVLDLQIQYARTKQQIKLLDAISNKEELLDSLTDISLRLNSLRKLTSDYDTKIVEENPELTKETLVKEKRLYLERRSLNDVNV